jgi:Flp pilus assembly protein TadD
MGKAQEAREVLQGVLDQHTDSIPAHYELGAVCEKLGDLKAAEEQYTWFVNDPQNFLKKWEAHENIPVFEKADQVTLIGRALDRWATLTQKYKNSPNLDRTILGLFVKSFDEIDREYWPARLAAAEYLLSHDQTDDAVKQLKEVLSANPGSIEGLQLMGRVALQQFNFDNADRAIALIRQVNKESLDADLLDARNLMQERRPQDAEPAVNRALSRQPKNVEALGLLAAVYALELKEDKVNDTLKQVEAIDPANASAYVEVAEQLDAMRQYPRAMAKYRVAIERAPWWTAARNGLGLLYTQSGDEDDARKVLEEAHQLDPFNLRTTNYLQLLDKMDRFARKESDHFVVIYDADTDPVIPEYFLDYLESVQSQVCSTFHFTPAVKTYIEVFPTHEAFSVRTTGSTWLPTVGASTGRVIALVAPRTGKTTMGTYNWARVLRHEYTHTVTLGATDNRIAHWFTEGLAVWEEQSPVPWDWVPMLYQAVSKKQFFPLDQLTWAFVRPKRPIDRQLAYAESFWICQYVEETYGHEAILKMLDLMKDADRQEDVFPKVTGKTIPQFMDEFQVWAEKQVAKWGYDDDSNKKYDGLRNQGEDLIQSRQYAEAAKVWEDIARLRPADSLPHQRLAGLYLAKGARDEQKAAEQLEILSKVELKDNRYAKRLSRLYRDMKDWDKAAKWSLDAVYIDPYDISAHEVLEDVCQNTDNPAGVAREKHVIEELTQLHESQKKQDEQAAG